MINEVILNKKISIERCIVQVENFPSAPACRGEWKCAKDFVG